MHLFKRSGLGLETLFYDMSLERPTWQALRGNLP
jgi:hypothetical protein